MDFGLPSSRTTFYYLESLNTELRSFSHNHQFLLSVQSFHNRLTKQVDGNSTGRPNCPLRNATQAPCAPIRDISRHPLPRPASSACRNQGISKLGGFSIFTRPRSHYAPNRERNEMTANISTRAVFKQPPECADYHYNFQSIRYQSDDSSPKWFTQVPRYQPENIHTDLHHILQTCCYYIVWTQSDPEACTMVCNSESLKEALNVQYCLNAHDIRYGMLENSGATIPEPLATSMWTFIMLGALMLSQVIF